MGRERPIRDLVMPVDGPENEAGRVAGNLLPVLQGLHRAAVAVGQRDELHEPDAGLIDLRGPQHDFEAAIQPRYRFPRQRHQLTTSKRTGPANRQ